MLWGKTKGQSSNNMATNDWRRVRLVSAGVTASTFPAGAVSIEKFHSKKAYLREVKQVRVVAFAVGWEEQITDTVCSEVVNALQL